MKPTKFLKAVSAATMLALAGCAVTVSRTVNASLDRGVWTADDCLQNGKSYFLQGKYKMAFTFYDRATKIDPENLYAWGLKAEAASELGRFDEAMHAYDTARKLRGYKRSESRAGDAAERLFKYATGLYEQTKE